MHAQQLGPVRRRAGLPVFEAGQHAEGSRRVALDERPLAAGGQGEVERAEDEPEVPQVSEECALNVGRGLDRRIRVGAVVGAPVEQTGVDPHREHAAADHGYPYVGDFVDAGLKQVHRPGDAGRGREASKTLAQRRRGIGDESAASQNRSVGS
ncbi:hypothetical protein OG760_32060 [Streptomyces sp. NBC_00963]|uniref:hypothetical protein n=1 Tax=Streptomyces sp. NBC_00963 TaxID=2903697 RepID=UPI00386E5D4C|nr:hypothetical protein OG760_32060 [Streptomyces sp. NBC_00963]